jgi:hypothetical protein
MPESTEHAVGEARARERKAVDLEKTGEIARVPLFFEYEKPDRRDVIAVAALLRITSRIPN